MAPPSSLRHPRAVSTAPTARLPRRFSSLAVLLGLALVTVAGPVRGLAREPAVLLASPEPLVSPEEVWDPALLRRSGLAPERLRCNPRVSWAPDLRQQAAEVSDQVLRALPAGTLPREAERQRLRQEVAELVFWRLVRVTIVDSDNHNAGVLPLRGFRWRDEAGVSQPLLVFRSAITRIDPGEPSCVGSLLTDGRVRHVVNLYDADRIPIGTLPQREEQLSRSCQASYLRPDEATQRYGAWREKLRSHGPTSPEYRQAMADLARLIREQILAPGGRPPLGNIYLHCGGGMHRSGMVMGVLDRCVNGTSMKQVRRRYLRHTGWISDEKPGGAEPGNLAVIAGFDCASLGPLPEGPPPAS